MAASDGDEGRPDGLPAHAHFQAVPPLEVPDAGLGAYATPPSAGLGPRRGMLQVHGGALSSRASSKALDDEPGADAESVASVRPSSRSIYGKRPQSVAQRKQSKLFVGMSLQQDPNQADEEEEEEQQQQQQQQQGKHRSLMQRVLRRLRPRVIMPNKRWYMIFWYFTMTFALANAIMDPYKLAFGPAGGFEPYNDFWAVVEYIGTVSFLVDIILKFFVAYEDEENREMVTDLRRIAAHYLKLFFWLDLLFWFPFVGVINSASPSFWAPENTRESTHITLPDSESNTAYYVGLLGFLKMGRLYRIFHLFAQLEHAMVMSQMSLMLTRNFFYVLLTCHWFACLFWFVARAEGFAPDASWVGRAADRFDGQNAGVVYIYTFYLSVMSFTAVGDGDLFANSPAESVIMSIYLLFNVVLGAYILGTVTMLMVKGDQRSASYRDRITNLKDYSNINALPKELHEAMRKHIELHFHSELSSDELVLAPYPMAIKKRVLRHLYLEPLRECYLFKTCKPKFLDAILAVCRTELFMPNVQLVTEGDIIADLSVVIEGEVEVVPASSEGSSTTSSNMASMPPQSRGKSRRSSFFMAPNELSMSASMKPNKSMTGSLMGRSKKHGAGKRGSSECFGEVAFFTETQSTDAIWTCQVTRVLVLPRAAYDELVKAYPNQARQVMTAVKAHVEKAMIAEIMDVLDTIPQTSNSIHTRLIEYMDDRGTITTTQLPKHLSKEIQALFNTGQARMFEQMELITSSFHRFCAKQDQQVVLDLLHYAQHNEEEELVNLLRHGVDPSCADFDQRSPLMIAAREGHDSIVRVLVKAGANVHAQDAFGNSALSEAVKNGRERAVGLLVDAGATLGSCSAGIDDFFCQRVAAGDEERVEMLLEAGADPNTVSFDERSLLHLAAAQGNVDIARMLVDSGANAHAVDRWGRTPLDDAQAAGNTEVEEFLEGLDKKKETAGPRGLASLGGNGSGNKSFNKRQTMLSKAPAQRRRRTSTVTMQAVTMQMLGLESAEGDPRTKMSDPQAGTSDAPAIPLALVARGLPDMHNWAATSSPGASQNAAAGPGLGAGVEAASTPAAPSATAASGSGAPPVPALAYMGRLEALLQPAVGASPRGAASTTITPRDILVTDDNQPQAVICSVHPVASPSSPLEAKLPSAHTSPDQPGRLGGVPGAGVQVQQQQGQQQAAAGQQVQVQPVEQRQQQQQGQQVQGQGQGAPVEQSPVESVVLRQSEMGNALPLNRSLGKMMTVGPQGSGPSATRGSRVPPVGLSGPLMTRVATRDLEEVEEAGGMDDDEEGRGGGLEEELAVAALARAAEKVAWGAGAGEDKRQSPSSKA